MKIAVNTRYLLRDKMEGFGVYSHEILRRMVAAHPDDDFQFYFDRAFDSKFVYGPNVHPRVLWPQARHPILYHIWYQMRLRRNLHRERPDVFFSPDSYVPLGMSVSAVITVHDVAPRRFPDHITRSQRRYYLRNMPRFLEQAAHLITVSDFSKREIEHFYEVPGEKITVVHNGVGAQFVPVPDKMQQHMRERYAGGKPYFLYVGAIHPRKNVARLINAFDALKSNVQSDIQLVLAGATSWKAQEVSDAIQKAKHSNEVHQVGYVEAGELPGLIGSALAMCYVSLYEGFGMPVLEAMACGVPVIVSCETSSGAALSEVAGDAALQVDPNATDEIAEAMQRIIEDESLRSNLAQRGLDRAQSFSWDRAAEETYAILSRVATRNYGKS